MKKVLLLSLLAVLVVGLSAVQLGCKKDDTTAPPVTGYTGPVYPVTATVLNPQGQAQGGRCSRSKIPRRRILDFPRTPTL